MNRPIPHIVQRALAIAALTSTGMASAADDPSTSAPGKGERRGGVQACRADAERLCATVEKGGGRKLACLREQAAQLTPACRDELAQITANRKNIAPK